MRQFQSPEEAVQYTLEKMKKNAMEKYKSNRPKVQQLEWVYDQLVRHHVNMQKDAGIICPSVSNAEDMAKKVMEKIRQEQIGPYEVQ